MTRIPKLVAALALTTTLAACGDDDEAQQPTPNIVELAQATPSLSILVDAVVAADLVETLSGPGPFTVFAPTNDAFAALLEELGVSKAELFADQALLTAVLTYHVLGSAVPKSAVPLGRAITPLQGGFFKIDSTDAGLAMKDQRNRTAGIVTTDLAASNGIVHVIDRVILPGDRNVVETAQATQGFGILAAAIEAAGLVGALSEPGPFTVFAPTDDAFAALLTELGISASDLFADTALLTSVLTYHVIPGRVLAADVVPGTQPATVQGGTFGISAALVITDGQGRTANIDATDVFATNGVIHVLDRVILPPSAP